MPPTYNTIKNENIQSKTTIKETKGITKGFKEIEENQEDCGLFLKTNISFIRKNINNIIGHVIKISYPSILLNPFIFVIINNNIKIINIVKIRINKL